ncbi:Alpha/Beta hydrolase protein [Penicillium canariense]|uniref:Alpha/Beta hydrolase protein n=1 Tax=Penicillium canariense TaxID=189055 RepID=A0A9W9I7S9_9EURO|nr:Alpha/Beta hydrolase protein [Penicillium canariense]KAJ5167392.1 Alpha/Beta hydrolase protein [Penicillium canariense]
MEKRKTLPYNSYQLRELWTPKLIVWANADDNRLLKSPFGSFPWKDDPFRFLPCTNSTVPPPLDDPNPQKTWGTLFDRDPDHWSWGQRVPDALVNSDPHANRGIYLCGYLDLPLDYLNRSDSRIVRLAVTKYQVSGLARLDSRDKILKANRKSERTIIIEPGGPGGSGTLSLWETAEQVSDRFSGGKYDVLGWDPRGVNISLPSASCFPHDALRDRWFSLARQYREVSNAIEQLELADALNNATFYACQTRLGDFGRFIGTASVARDLEEIRKAHGEDEVSGYFLSYGTGIAQTYANMFPDKVGRMILDGTEYVKDHRLLGGFGWTSLDNTTDIWRDGFLGECVNAGPEWCALAKPNAIDGGPVTLAELEARMTKLIGSLAIRPISAFTEESGPSLVTYSAFVEVLYSIMYNPRIWPDAAQMLYELEQGNATLAAKLLDTQWEYRPTIRKPTHGLNLNELPSLVICADSYDAPSPADGLRWWDRLWGEMTTESWIAGNSRFASVLPCRYYEKYWGSAAEVYRGDLNKTMKTPVLLIAETYDPATPLGNGRRLLRDMGQNARLIVHHGYGHTSRWDKSECTDRIGKAYILDGTLPDEAETNCYADGKPYISIQK